MIIDGIVFDMDGVIFDSENLCMKLWEELVIRHSISKDIKPPMYESIGTNMQITTEIFKRYFGEDFPFEEYTEEIRTETRKYIEEKGIPLKKGAKNLIKSLKEAGFKIGLASSTRYPSVERNLKNADLFQYFDVIIGGDMVSKSKPEPDIFIKCMEELNIKSEETIIIEDSYNGIRAAYRAGAIPFMVPDMVAADEEMKKLSFEIFSDLDEVFEFIINDRIKYI